MLRILPRLLILSALALPTAAFASTVDFNATGSAGGISGSGVLVTTDEGSGKFLITAIQNPAVLSVFAPGGYNGNDNLLFPNAAQLVDSSGFAFIVDTGTDIVRVDVFSAGASYEAFITDPGGNTATIPIQFAISSVTPVPEPSSYLLLGTGLLCLLAASRHSIFAAASQKA